MEKNFFGHLISYDIIELKYFFSVISVLEKKKSFR